jgi:tetratricopeptide (TPR) repeat protein
LREEALKLMKAKFGPDHPNALNSMKNLAWGLRGAGRLAELVLLREEMLRLERAKLGPDHFDTLRTMDNLAEDYKDAGRLAEALQLLEETLRLRRAKLGPEHLDTQTAMDRLAKSYWAANRLDRCVPLFEESLKLHEKKHGRTHLSTLWAIADLGLSYKDAGRLADALPLRESLATRERAQPEAWTTFNSQSLLGGALLGQKKYAEAEPLLRKGYEGIKAREKAIPPRGATRIPEVLDRLIELYTATKKPEEVKRWQAERGKYDAETASSSRNKK